jgi:hypothetical protein
MKHLYLLLSLFLLVACQKQVSEERQNHLSTTEAATQTITASEDSYIYDAYPSTNYGKSSSLVVKGSKGTYNRVSLVKFQLPQTVSSAKLRLYGNASASVSAVGISDTWTETGVTWNNQPQAGATISTFAVTQNAYSEVDISGYAQGKTTLSVALKDLTKTETFLQFGSRESANPPQLVVSYGGTIPEDSTVNKPPSDTTSTPSDTTTSTKPDHIVFVWMENKGYNQIIGSTSAPYINSLVKQGTLFTQAYALTHPSQPNYIRWFSGATQGITDNTCPGGSFSTPNLYTVLKSAGASFAWYSETMPSEGYTGCSYGNYVRKHNPTPNFKNVPTTANKVFSSTFWQNEANFSSLPQVVCITPNLQDDFHDGSVSKGDTWLKNNLGKYQAWAMTHNSILVIYYDEDETKEGNRIPVLFLGQNVKVGQVSTKYTHYDFLRGVCDWYGASVSWTSNVTNAKTPTGIWK